MRIRLEVFFFLCYESSCNRNISHWFSEERTLIFDRLIPCSSKLSFGVSVCVCVCVRVCVAAAQSSVWTVMGKITEGQWTTQKVERNASAGTWMIHTNTCITQRGNTHTHTLTHTHTHTRNTVRPCLTASLSITLNWARWITLKPTHGCII